MSVHIQCQASIYTLSLCRGHTWRVRLAKQETLTPPGQLVSPLVCRGPWMPTVVLYCWCHSDSASVLLYLFRGDGERAKRQTLYYFFILLQSPQTTKRRSSLFRFFDFEQNKRLSTTFGPFAFDKKGKHEIAQITHHPGVTNWQNAAIILQNPNLESGSILLKFPHIP